MARAAVTKNRGLYLNRKKQRGATVEGTIGALEEG
jgi:hypothetical protein